MSSDLPGTEEHETKRKNSNCALSREISGRMRVRYTSHFCERGVSCTGQQRAVLKTVILFVAEYDCAA
jgi:hypothetical protein